MSRTVLGIIKLAGTEDPCVFKQACDRAGVSFKCESVASVDEGIAWLSGTGMYRDRNRYPIPALVVLDWDLDQNGGPKGLKWMRKEEPLKYLPVVVLSASKSQVDMKRAYDGGASSYLLKPESFDQLVELVRIIDRYWLTLNQTPGP